MKIRSSYKGSVEIHNYMRIVCQGVRKGCFKITDNINGFFFVQMQGFLEFHCTRL